MINRPQTHYATRSIFYRHAKGQLPAGSEVHMAFKLVFGLTHFPLKESYCEGA